MLAVTRVEKAQVLDHETGRREVIGLDVGEAETEAFWRDFLRGLVARGLLGVQLAISDAHPGLKAAIAQVLGCAWQRCCVHFLRDLLGHAYATVPRGGGLFQRRADDARAEGQLR